MAVTSATLSGSLTVTETVADGLATGTLVGGISASLGLAAGTAAGQFDRYFEKSVTLAAGASVTYTLSALTDDLGRNQSMARVLGYGLDNRAAAEGTGDVKFASGATHGWTAPFGGAAGALTVPGGAFVVFGSNRTTGLAVAAGTSDQVTLTNTGSGPTTFGVGFVGRSI